MATRRLSGIATSSSVPDNGGDHSGSGGGGAGGYVDDVFSTYLYEGSYDAANGTGQTQDIVNGIDLAGEGGMVWIKNREGANPHTLTDTERGAGKSLRSDSTNAELDEPQALTSFTGDGFSVGTDSAVNQGPWNGAPGKKIASWTFRKAKNFFDVVTYTGDGVAGREIPHNLGVEPGMVIVKGTDNAGSWPVYHQGLGGSNYFTYLNDTAGRYNNSTVWTADPSDTGFYVGTQAEVNASGAQYVAYVFAHDDSDESMIKCGSYTGNGSDTGPVIDLGFEPQWVMIKAADYAGQPWAMFDAQRSVATGGDDYVLRANAGNEENPFDYLSFLSNGFQLATFGSWVNASDKTYIYMAIRRPNKPAEEFDPEELFAMDGAGLNASAGGQVFESPFPVDAYLATQPALNTSNYVFDRLRGGGAYLQADKPEKELKNAYQDKFDRMDGIGTTTAANYTDWQAWMWRRASGFFDVVAYVGTGGSVNTIPHNLSVAPEMMWVKRRDWSESWYIYSKPLGAEKFMHFTDQAAQTQSWAFNNTEPTDTVFTVGSNLAGANQTFVAYLFASVPGISAIGTYTGDGSGYQVIYPDGLSGASIRFVLVKRVDGTGNWMMFDRERGTDAALSLNLTDAQKTGDFWSWTFGGFGVKNNNAHGPEWNPNTNGAEYLYYAITL